MGEHFLRIKKKTRLSAVLTSIVIGAGGGFVSVSASLLMKKLFDFEIGSLSYIICASVSLVALIVSLFLLMPSEKRLARVLDRKYDLDERVRTMVEFKDSDELFARLQREDTNEKLGKLKIAFFNKKQLITIVSVIVIATTLFTGAALTPNIAQKQPEEMPVSSFDKELIVAELSELISTVESSIMTEGLKSDTVKSLKGLIEFVKEHDYMSEMKLEAISSVLEISSALDHVNSSPKLGELLAQSTNVILKELGTELVNMSGAKAKKLLENLKEELEVAESEEVGFVADELNAVLEQADTAPDNVLVKQLSNLVSALRGYANGIGDIDTAFSSLPLALSNEVMIQNVNKMTTQTVISKLCSIFGVSPKDLEEADGGDNVDIRPPSEIVSDEENTEIEEPDNPIGVGGIGTGDRVYGSNDVIYDPHTNTYVTYGTLLDEYNAKATDKILDGRINEDFKKFIEEYFKSLSEYTPSET